MPSARSPGYLPRSTVRSLLGVFLLSLAIYVLPRSVGAQLNSQHRSTGSAHGEQHCRTAQETESATSASAHSPAAALIRTMDTMDQAMSQVPMSGDPDSDFAAMMIPHHRGAIEMAKIELQFGTDPRLRRLAQEILITQQSEIALMQQFLDRHPVSPTARTCRRHRQHH